MGDLELALYGSFLPIPSIELFQVKYIFKENEKIDLFMNFFCF